MARRFRRYRKRPSRRFRRGLRRLRRKVFKKRQTFRAGSTHNQFGSTAKSGYVRRNRGVRVSRRFKKAVHRAIAGDRRGVDDNVTNIDVRTTLPSNDGEYARGLHTDLFGNIATKHGSSVDQINYATGKMIRMKGIRFRFWLNGIVDHVVDPESETDQAYIGPVDLRFIFVLVKDQAVMSGTPTTAFKTSSNYDIERYNAKWMRKHNSYTVQGADSAVPEPLLDEDIITLNEWRDSRYVQYVCEKRVKLEPLDVKENIGADGTHVIEGQTVECDWYIPVDKKVKLDESSNDPDKWNMVMLVYDCSSKHQGLRLTTSTDTFAQDAVVPMKFVGLADYNQKLITNTQAYTATDTNIPVGSIEFTYRRYWENLD